MVLGIGLLVNQLGQSTSWPQAHGSAIKAAVHEEDAAHVRGPLAYSKLPLYFIPNAGQVDEHVKFYEIGAIAGGGIEQYGDDHSDGSRDDAFGILLCVYPGRFAQSGPGDR